MAAALTTDGFGLLSKVTATTTAPVVAALPTETPSPTTTPLPVATQAPMEAAMPEPTDPPTQTPTASPTANVRGGASAIVFSSNRGEDGYLQIWTMDPDGSNPRQLTFGPGDKTQPRWSPDGERLAFVSNQEGNQDIFIMNADGTTLAWLQPATGWLSQAHALRICARYSPHRWSAPIWTRHAACRTNATSALATLSNILRHGRLRDARFLAGCPPMSQSL